MRTSVFFCLLLAPATAVWAVTGQEEEIVLGKPSPIRSTDPSEDTLLLVAGTEIRQLPRLNAPVVELVDAPVEVPVVEQRGPWSKIRLGSWQGWVYTGDSPIPPPSGPIATVDPDDKRLQQARSILGETVVPANLGPFVLFSDVTDSDLLQSLSAVAFDVSRAYRERYALQPSLYGDEVVVLFRQESDYRQFVSAESRVAGAESRGYTSEGLSVLFTGNHDKTSLVSVLIHELVHLLNRTVFPDDTPPWLEEGMAEDLAFSQVNRRGAIQLGTLAGAARQGIGDSYSTSEPRAHLAALMADWTGPRRPDLESLTSMDWDEFVRPEVRSIHYAQSVLFIRYLLDEAKEEQRLGFGRYLESLSQAKLPESVSLWRNLGVSAQDVEPKLYLYLASQARAHGLW